MSSCWSCLVILEQGTQLCPLCGADQTRPVKVAEPGSSEPQDWRSLLRHWALPLSVISLGLAAMAVLFWYNFATPSISPADEAATAAAKSLRSLREALSDYALSAKDAYPETLAPLDDRVRRLMQESTDAGYTLRYDRKLSPTGGPSNGFVISARPAKSGYLNLFIDESGVVRATQENRPATAHDAAF